MFGFIIKDPSSYQSAFLGANVVQLIYNVYFLFLVGEDNE
jgi:hypothetical protein